MLNETQNILNRLAAADRQYQKEAGLRLLLRSVKYFCGALLVEFILDLIFHLGAGWRLALGAGLIAGICTLTIISWRVAFVRRNRIEHIARFLEMRDPALGSRLINLLQLNEQSRDETITPSTRELARQAVENYSAALGAVPIERIARTGEGILHLKKALLAALVFAAVLGAGFRITPIEVARFIDPFGDHPPYSFTHLEIAQPGPLGTNVLYGKGLIVKVKASGHRPKDVFLTFFPSGHNDRGVSVPMFGEGGSEFNQLMDNVRTDMVVFAHTKDHVSESKRVHVGVVLTPQLERTFLTIVPPAYTGLRAAETLYAFNGVQALEGSTVRIRLQSNRPLREGWLEMATGEQAPQRIVLKKSAENEVTGSFVATESGRFRMGVVDIAGLVSQGDRESALTVTHDLPPEVHITNPDHDAFAAMDFKLQVQIEASDDYGLSEIRFHRGLNGVYSAPQVVNYENTIALDGRVTGDFDLATLGVEPGDVISFFAEAVDNAPQPHLARSQTVHLTVISLEDYNNYMREQTDIADTEARYDDLNSDLQDLIAQQKELGEAAEKLKSEVAKADAKQRAALAEQLDSLLAKQNELNEQLEKQADRMEHFVREHPLYDVENDLQKSLRQQAEDIRLSIQYNESAGNDIAQQSSPAGQPRQISPDLLADFKKAADAQVKRLDQTHDETDRQMVQTLDDMSQMQELQKDFNLFEALYRAQQEIAQQSQAYNRPGQLSREDQLALKDLAAAEKQVADALEPLPGKLRDDAKAAEKLFPKAAKSGRNLADKINEGRMEPLAGQSTDQMLSGDGEQSFQLADRLRGEMEKLFGECQGGNSPSSAELDNYLTLHKTSPGNNFAEMARSRKFGFGKGRGQGKSGEGAMGASGYAMIDGSDPNVLGNESSARSGNTAARQSSRYGKGGAAMPDGGKGEVGKPDVLKGLNPVNRQSAANASDAVIQQYNDVVDSYFKTITTKKEKDDHEK